MQYQEDFESHSIGVFVVVVWDVKADDSTPAFDLKFTSSAMFTLDQRTRLVTLKVRLLSNAGLDLLPYLFIRSFKWTTGSRKNKSIRFNYKGT